MIFLSITITVTRIKKITTLIMTIIIIKSAINNIGVKINNGNNVNNDNSNSLDNSSDNSYNSRNNS